MATIKSYTDLEQSKKLAKVLPLESADYTHLGKNDDNIITRSYLESCSSELNGWVGKENLFPCWSLAALFGVLPKIGSEEPMLQKNLLCKWFNGKIYLYVFNK